MEKYHYQTPNLVIRLVTTNSTLDKKLSPINSTTKLEPKIKTEQPIQLLDLITIGNITIAKIDNCNQTTLDKLGNFTTLDLESTTNVTKQQPNVTKQQQQQTTTTTCHPY